MSPESPAYQSPVSVRSVLAVLAILVLVAITGIGVVVYHSERYRYQKIEFILWDYQNENNAGLSQAELLWYLGECGAQTVLDPEGIEVDYDGWLVDGTWRVEVE